jgi:hypothetical protein
MLAYAQFVIDTVLVTEALSNSFNSDARSYVISYPVAKNQKVQLSNGIGGTEELKKLAKRRLLNVYKFSNEKIEKTREWDIQNYFLYPYLS